MITRGIITSLFLIFASVLTFSACDVTSEKGLDESMEIVPNVKPVKGASNASLTVNKGESNNSYFSIDLNNVEKNTSINNGSHEAWCIVYDKPLDSNGGQYDGVTLYNTFGDKTFKPLNHFLNARYDLRKEFENLTWKEEQVIIWSVMDKHNPFDLDSVDITQLSRLHDNGQPLFDTNLVRDILTRLKNEVDSFEYRSGQVYAIAAETGDGSQPVVFVGETMFAYGGYEGSYQCELDMSRWGWAVEFDPVAGKLLYDGEEWDDTPFIAGAGKGVEKCDPYEIIEEMEVGRFSASIEDGIMSLNYKAADGYVFSDPHVWVGCTVDDVKDLGGNPPANFYGLNDMGGHTLSNYDAFSDQTFTLDVSSLNCGDNEGENGNYFISAHAGNEDKSSD